MITVFPCYADPDRELAARLADYLNQDGRVYVYLEEGRLGPSDTLATKARDGRMADRVLVFLSEHSVPPRWPRQEWEGPFFREPAGENVPLGFIVAGTRDPARAFLQNPAHCFDLRQNQTAQFRRIKRWILNRGPAADAQPLPAVLEPLALAAADRPGTVVLTGPSAPGYAAAFAARCQPDFERIIWIECGGRSLASLAGHLAWRLDLQLPGPAAENAAALRRECSGRRLLLVLAGVSGPAPLALIPGGRTSTILTGQCDGLSCPHLEIAAGDLDGPTPETPEDPVWTAAARDVVRVARDAGRLAEAYEHATTQFAEAERAADAVRLRILASDLVPILESWNRQDEADRLRLLCPFECARQLSLFD